MNMQVRVLSLVIFLMAGQAMPLSADDGSRLWLKFYFVPGH